MILKACCYANHRVKEPGVCQSKSQKESSESDTFRQTRGLLSGN